MGSWGDAARPLAAEVRAEPAGWLIPSGAVEPAGWLIPSRAVEPAGWLIPSRVDEPAGWLIPSRAADIHNREPSLRELPGESPSPIRAHYCECLTGVLAVHSTMSSLISFVFVLEKDIEYVYDCMTFIACEDEIIHPFFLRQWSLA